MFHALTQQHGLVLAASGENLPLLTLFAAGFAAAWLFGLITHRLGLSPIVGYLAAGVLIGRHTPGFQGDEDLAHQLAEIGVILLMFGVGLHFHVKDLLAVKRVAIPGAVGQSLLAAGVTVAIFHLGFGFPFKSTLVLGMAMAVASTVVLLRVLMDRGMLSSSHGHVAVGWLIVEDIFTVLALVMVPVLAGAAGESGAGAADGGSSALATIGWALAKLVALVGIVLLAGSKVVPWILERVARLRSGELFTLTVLVLSIAVAVGAAALFGASVALGAFLAGMVVAQSPLSHQAAADALPLRDAFSVLFFVSVGMLFRPSFVVEQPLMVAAGVGIVLLVKPLAALAIVAALGYPARTALTVAIGLAQIGEFSFILAQAAHGKGLMPEEGVNVLVAAAIISITLNPLLFRSLDRIEDLTRRCPPLWKLLNARADRRIAAINAAGTERLAAEAQAVSAAAESAAAPAPPSRAIVVGYGPVGRLVDAILRDAGVRTVVVDMNVDTVKTLTDEGRAALYGDASRREVLDQAGIASVAHVIVTLPSAESRTTLVMAARELNPTIEITVRARYLAEREGLLAAGASTVICEEGEAGVALARHVMERRGLDAATTDKLLAAVRQLWKLKK